ncbi:GTP-binding protein EngA [Candidatus Nasuia deltocephalinicola]|nr:GTP-binding protein EngA [Candidatus Nasuia deltocephalinicola]
MIPVITLIGLEKVGKSTLFNILLNNKLFFNNFLNIKYTKYSLCFYDYIFLLIDKSSFVINNYNYISIEYDLNLIIDETDIILFIVDISFLYFYKNLLILNFLRKTNKYIFIIFNKFDNNKLYFNLKKIIKLGFLKPYLISSLHNYNIKYCINNILHIYCYDKKCLKHKKKNKNIIIVFIGFFKSGKSRLINSIFNKNRYSLIIKKFNFYLKYKKNYYIFFDIPYNINFSKIFKIFILSNVIVFLIDPVRNLFKYDFKLINIIFKNYLNIVFIITKSDLLNIKEKIFFKNYINIKLNIKNFYIIFISSLFNYNIFYIKYILNKVYFNSIININTSKLNKIIFKYSKFLKIYYNYDLRFNYIHQGGKNPILIIIHGKIFKLKNCYKKFLKKFFYKKLNIKSVFLRIKF